MEQAEKIKPEDSKIPPKLSPVKVVIEWLIEADREYRVAQSMVDKTHNKL